LTFKPINPSLIFLSLITLLLFSNFSAYAENFSLEIDDEVYDIEYDFNGDIIAMAIDKETFSLLIATENVIDSQFQIKLPNDLIRAENNEFAILVNGFEVDYEVLDTVDVNLTFFVPAFTEEIEIIGTFVVPEFPLGAVLVLGTITGIIIIVQKSKKFLFR
jgi:predicted secreted protein with PEFG-CTERM motif